MAEHSNVTVSVPYQEMFIKEFLRADSPRHHLLVAPPGTGKTHAACAIVEGLAATGHAKHVLVLVPAPLRAQWASVLTSTAIPAPVVPLDRQVFRELQASVPVGQLPWNRAPVAVMNLELLRHSDVYNAVVGQHWDLVIVDECHRIKVVANQRQGTKVDGTVLLRHLIEQHRMHRLLMMTATPSHEERYVPDLAVTEWRFEPPPLRAQELLYSPAGDEIRFVSALHDFLDRELKGEAAERIRENVRQHVESSVFSVEPGLLWMKDELAGSLSQVAGPAGTQADGFFHTLLPPLPWRDRNAAAQRIQSLLAMLDDVRTDSKLQVFLQAVQEHRQAHAGQEALCVVALYTRTASYLHSALTAVGVDALAVTSFLDRERIAAVDEFRIRRGCLVITYNGLKGMEIPDARAVVVYDNIPPAAFEQVVGRFNRYGRREPLTVVRMRRVATEGVIASLQAGAPSDTSAITGDEY